MRTLLLGECLVDLVGQAPATTPGEAGSFIPQIGGAAAAIAEAAAIAGARVALGAGVGDDAWGAWLRERMPAGVALDWCATVPGTTTAVATVLVDDAGAPRVTRHGDALAAFVAAVEPVLDEAVEACDALGLTTATLASEPARDLTMAAREAALALGRPVVLDADLTTSPWTDPAHEASVAREFVAEAFLVLASAEDARLLTGERDPAAAAEGLLAGGAQHVVVLRADGSALLRGGGMSVDAPGGAGMTRAARAGRVIAGLAATDYYPPAIATTL